MRCPFDYSCTCAEHIAERVHQVHARFAKRAESDPWGLSKVVLVNVERALYGGWSDIQKAARDFE